jgi:hypothetical protein
MGDRVVPTTRLMMLTTMTTKLTTATLMKKISTWYMVRYGPEEWEDVEDIWTSLAFVIAQNVKVGHDLKHDDG